MAEPLDPPAHRGDPRPAAAGRDLPRGRLPLRRRPVDRGQPPPDRAARRRRRPRAGQPAPPGLPPLRARRRVRAAAARPDHRPGRRGLHRGHLRRRRHPHALPAPLRAEDDRRGLLPDPRRATTARAAPLRARGPGQHPAVRARLAGDDVRDRAHRLPDVSVVRPPCAHAAGGRGRPPQRPPLLRRGPRRAARAAPVGGPERLGADRRGDRRHRRAAGRAGAGPEAGDPAPLALHRPGGDGHRGADRLRPLRPGRPAVRGGHRGVPHRLG